MFGNDVIRRQWGGGHFETGIYHEAGPRRHGAKQDTVHFLTQGLCKCILSNISVSKCVISARHPSFTLVQICQDSDYAASLTF